MGKIIEGSYKNQTEALQAIQRLREQGYQKKDIFLVANAEVRNSLPSATEAEVKAEGALSTVGEDDRSLWEKIKDAFSIDEYETRNYEDEPLYAYKNDLDQGKFVVMINEKGSGVDEQIVNDQMNDTPYPDSIDRENVLGDNRDSDLADSMDEVTSIGTGQEGTSMQRSRADDLETSKRSDVLPGQNGDAFHTEGLYAEEGNRSDYEQEKGADVDHPYTPNPDLLNIDKTEAGDDGSTLDRDGVTGVDASLHIDEDRDPDTSDIGGPEDNIPANPDVPMNTNDTLERSPLPSDKGGAGAKHTLAEEVPAVDQKITDNAPLEDEGLNLDMDEHHIGTSEDDDLNKHI